MSKATMNAINASLAGLVLTTAGITAYDQLSPNGASKRQAEFTARAVSDCQKAVAQGELDGKKSIQIDYKPGSIVCEKDFNQQGQQVVVVKELGAVAYGRTMKKTETPVTEFALDK